MVRAISILLLMILGLSACFGGLALILDPSGSSLYMTTEALRESYFQDYRGPGLILFFPIGLLSLITAWLTYNQNKNFPILIFYQGVMLTGWIMVQVYLLPETHYLQAVFGCLGILLMFLGNYQRKIRAL